MLSELLFAVVVLALALPGLIVHILAFSLNDRRIAEDAAGAAHETNTQQTNTQREGRSLVPVLDAGGIGPMVSPEPAHVGRTGHLARV